MPRTERVFVVKQVFDPEEIAALRFRLPLLLRRISRLLEIDASRETELAVLVGPKENGNASERAGRRVTACVSEEQCRVILAEREGADVGGLVWRRKEDWLRRGGDPRRRRLRPIYAAKLALPRSAPPYEYSSPSR